MRWFPLLGGGRVLGGGRMRWFPLPAELVATVLRLVRVCVSTLCPCCARVQARPSCWLATATCHSGGGRRVLRMTKLRFLFPSFFFNTVFALSNLFARSVACALLACFAVHLHMAAA